MNETINFFEEGKTSSLQFWIGVLFFGVSIAWIIQAHIDTEHIQYFDWLYFGIMFLNGIVHTAGGLGYQTESIFGKQYIHFDDEKVSLKTNRWKPAQNLSWNRLNEVQYSYPIFYLHIDDETIEEVNISQLSYPIVQKLKKQFVIAAQEKQFKLEGITV